MQSCNIKIRTFLRTEESLTDQGFSAEERTTLCLKLLFVFNEFLQKNLGKVDGKWRCSQHHNDSMQVVSGIWPQIVQASQKATLYSNDKIETTLPKDMLPGTSRCE